MINVPEAALPSALKTVSATVVVPAPPSGGTPNAESVKPQAAINASAQ
jgi:hypothetical protein